MWDRNCNSKGLSAALHPVLKCVGPAKHIPSHPHSKQICFDLIFWGQNQVWDRLQVCNLGGGERHNRSGWNFTDAPPKNQLQFEHQTRANPPCENNLLTLRTCMMCQLPECQLLHKKGRAHMPSIYHPGPWLENNQAQAKPYVNWWPGEERFG